ncbi:MAG: alpha/beta hydrolase family protein [Lishizhenia sp.]
MQLKNKIYRGAENRKSLYDLTVPNKFNGKMILFLHGYKGFKDWGCWNLMQEFFLKQNYGFCKFNFSHNGGTIDEGIDFPDLEAFGKNRYSFELEDTRIMIDLIFEKMKSSISEFILIGHSRGGGIATLTSTDSRVNKLITLASISDIESRFPKNTAFEEWQEKGVYFIKNGRTNQEMPHYFSFYEDYIKNNEILNIKNKAQTLVIPCLHIHGDKDTAVLPNESKALAGWTNGTFLQLEDAQHTFNTKHPWDENELPSKMMEVCQEIIKWL